MRTLLRTMVALVLCALVAASCGSDSTAKADAQLDGQEFWSVDVVENGQSRPLVSGTRITLRFDGDQLGASAGCNSMGGTFDVNGDTLVVTDLFMTEMGCDAERHAQDEFLSSFLTASPTVELEGDELTLATADVTMRLLNTSVANPDREILDTQWTVTGFIDGQTASSMAVTEPGTIVFGADSAMSGFDGCASFSAPVEVSDGSTGGPVAGDGEMQFGEVDRQVVADCPDGDYADLIHRLFATGDATFNIDGTNLTMLNGDGVGVTFSAA